MGLIIHVGVHRLVMHDVILQQGLQICTSLGAEQEAVDLGAQLLECRVRGHKDGLAIMMRSVVDGHGDLRLDQTLAERTELRGIP
jgi:hypothetical protein